MFFFFSFILRSAGTAKFTIWQVLFFCGLSLGMLVWPKLDDVFIIIYSLEFFTKAFDDGLSLEFEWQQVSPSLQDSSQYSGHSQ